MHEALKLILWFTPVVLAFYSCDENDFSKNQTSLREQKQEQLINNYWIDNNKDTLSFSDHFTGQLGHVYFSYSITGENITITSQDGREELRGALELNDNNLTIHFSYPTEVTYNYTILPKHSNTSIINDTNQSTSSIFQ